MISLCLSVACVFLYFSQSSIQPANGGTWQGYVLGGIATLLILWLMMLGIRKRQYSSRLGTVSGWVSAHVYLGSALLLIASLHCAGQFGMNIHTLAYVLMTLVIVSGFYGLYAYIRFPKVASENRVGHARSFLFEELSLVNVSLRRLSVKCDGDTQLTIDSSIDRTAIGGGIVSQLFAIDASKMQESFAEKHGSILVSNKDQQGVIDFIANKITRARKQGQPALLQEILTLLCRRQALLRRIRTDIQLHGLMKAWLLIHIPMSVALLVALSIHIFSVFFYW